MMRANPADVQAIRDLQWLHRHPEVALHEFETTRYILSALEEIEGVEIVHLGLPTGTLARIAGDSNGPVVAVRADIDALPLDEESGLDYASENAGAMHACGHDFHTAALLALARLLSQKRSSLPGTVYLLFQPAEESAYGGQQVVNTGFIEREGIQAIFAMHVSAQHPVGTIAIAPGPFNAAVDRFHYKITGRGGHASAPHEGLDPIPAAAHLVGRINDLVSRRIDTTKPAVVSVSQIHAGTAWNIMPETAELEGTARSFHPDVRERIANTLAAEAQALRAEGYHVDLQWLPGCPATNNDTALAERIAGIAREQGFRVVPQYPKMGGEDFSCYQERIPGALFDVGTGSAHPLHNPKFIADPAALVPAVRLMEEVVLRTLAK